VTKKHCKLTCLLSANYFAFGKQALCRVFFLALGKETSLPFLHPVSNSNSLTNQLGIHLILAKQEKLTSNSLANQIGKTHLPTRIYACADRGCHRRFPVGGRVKKEIQNKEGFLM
jgi:hypothetical protein